MKWYRLYKESDGHVNLKKLLKQNGVTKFPSGMKFSDTKAEWEKHRGHAGKKTIYNMCVQLERAGWKRGDWTTGGIPDGSAVSNSEKYTSPDGQIVMSYYEYYGATAYSNSYYITFKFAGTGVNESSTPKYQVGDKVVVTIGGVKKMERCGEIVEVIEDPKSVLGRHFDSDGPMYVIHKTGGFKDDPWGENPEFVAFEDEVELADCPLNESSRFGFNVGDEVELTFDVEPNRFSDRGVVPAGTVGEVVAVDKPMRGVIKVKIEDGTVVSVPERKLKFAGTDNEPWEKYKTPAKPKPSLREILDKHGPEEIYMEPARPGYPKWTGD